MPSETLQGGRPNSANESSQERAPIPQSDSEQELDSDSHPGRANWWEDEQVFEGYRKAFYGFLKEKGDFLDPEEHLANAKLQDSSLQSGSHMRLTRYHWEEIGEIENGLAWLFINTTVSSMYEIDEAELERPIEYLHSWHVEGNPFKIPPEEVVRIFLGDLEREFSIEERRGFESHYWAFLAERARLQSEYKRVYAADIKAKGEIGSSDGNLPPFDFVPAPLAAVAQGVEEINNRYISSLVSLLRL